MKITQRVLDQLRQMEGGPVPNLHIKDREVCAKLINAGLAEPYYEFESVRLTAEGKAVLAQAEAEQDDDSTA